MTAMRFSTLQENMRDALAIVRPAVASRSTLPVLSNVLIEAEGDRLMLTANSFDMAVSTVIGAKVEESGAITLPYKFMTEFVNALPPERIDGKLDEDTMTANFRCARYETNVKGIDAGEFPRMSTMTGVEVPLDYDTLQSLAKQVAICAATDEARPVFTAVWLQMSESTLTSAAADGFRLGKMHTNGLRISPAEFSKIPTEMVKVVGGQQFVEALIPAKAVVEVAKISKMDDEEPVTVTIGERRVRFSIGPTTVICNTLNGDYPDIHRIIPTKSPITVQVGGDELSKALKVARLFAKDSANIITMTVAPNADGQYEEIIISANSAELGDGTAPVPAYVEGVKGTFEIAFNVAYFLQAVEAIAAPQIKLEMSTSMSPGVLSAAGSDRYINVIMPMHIPRTQDVKLEQ